MTIGLDTPSAAPRWRPRWHTRLRRGAAPAVSTEDAVLRALCHDLGTPLASLRALLAHLDDRGRVADPGSDPGAGLGNDPGADLGSDHGADLGADLAELALAQADSLVSMLRTAVATGGALPGGWPRPLTDVVRASLQASGLPARQVRLAMAPDAAVVPVGDARVQRILTNLLENAYRHGAGRSVVLAVGARHGWARLVVTQDGVPDRVVAHLQADRPPTDLTGLGLWSVQRQTRELGGHVACIRDEAGLSVVVDLPDR
ncbi:ATP-binding protein [Klenkia sp. LSe6-5]|uniref:histidine kinase n=1 Tax=Klenkia sesuvii TaxID=3103137 RepID=A0ABU8DTS5_9ACTN